MKELIKKISLEEVDNKPAIVVTLQFENYLIAEEYYSLLQNIIDSHKESEEEID